ncbi:DUF2493 domain-containing protein (plasmid) [Streptosporangium sp. NBC_01495]|uniref:SLOG family protein n=1 Tax=Streptosporangium sp. NBC_01495 TaxID=2903899 RepID=UPI002E326DFA|nr:SLOG family protein [Streptosporangium sp. NBC_01495]
MLLTDPRVLICGSRSWPWPTTVTAILDRLLRRYGDSLIVIEGAARGADTAAHSWCLAQGLNDGQRHRCFPVDWAAQRRARPTDWRLAGPERNTRMLEERPQLIVACHNAFDPASGGTSDMALRGVLAGVPTWLVSGPDPSRGRWVSLQEFPQKRAARLRSQLQHLLSPL